MAIDRYRWQHVVALCCKLKIKDLEGGDGLRFLPCPD